MTSETFPGPAAYTVTNEGPYAFGFEFTDGAITVSIGSDGILTELAPEDYTVDPSAGAAGNVTLSAGALEAYAGLPMIIDRRTDIEQGWQGLEPREKGLEAQLDRLTHGIQEAQTRATRTLRTTTAIPAIIPADGTTIIWNATTGQFENGPTAAEISSAELMASAAAQSLADAEVIRSFMVANYPGLHFETVPDMVASEALLANARVTVASAYNGEGEPFLYDPLSTATPDDDVIFAATGMGEGRLISQRRHHNTRAELVTDPRAYETFAEGDEIEAGGRFIVLASDADDGFVQDSGLRLKAALSIPARVVGNEYLTLQSLVKDPAILATDADAAFVEAVQKVQEHGGKIFLPGRQAYMISPDLHLARPNVTIEGESAATTVIVAKLDLPGALIGRDWDPDGPNDYMRKFTLRRVTVRTRHKASPTDGGAYEQIALKMNHIGRSLVEDVDFGNVPIPGTINHDLFPLISTHANAAQGIAVSWGSVSSGSIAYSGGEVNIMQRCRAYGGKYLYAFDLPQFDPPGYASASYNVALIDCEGQIGQFGLEQGSTFGAGITARGLMLQAIQRQTGSLDDSRVINLEGKSHNIDLNYVEAPSADVGVRFGTVAAGNRVRLGVNGDTLSRVYAAKTGNQIDYFDRATGRFVSEIDGVDQHALGAVAWGFVTLNAADAVPTVVSAEPATIGASKVNASRTHIGLPVGLMDGPDYAVVLGGQITSGNGPGSIKVAGGQSATGFDVVFSEDRPASADVTPIKFSFAIYGRG